MSKYKLITKDNDPEKYLTTKTHEVTIDDYAELAELQAAMLNICTEHEGIGLSANQVGSRLRVFLIKKDKPKFYINPVLEDLAGSQIHEEGCLSIPGLGVVIDRAKSVLLMSDNHAPEMLSGLVAVVAQHELDHLDGILMTDRNLGESK